MEIPLTSFIDFVLKSGSPKMTCAKKIHAQLSEEYDPITDYYKRFREAVQELHKKGLGKAELIKLIGDLPPSKSDNYKAMVNGYKKFLGTKDIKWFIPPRKVWKHGSVEISINPELGLEWDDNRYIIKLYLKNEKPSKDRFSSVLALMKYTLAPKGANVALLDVRNSKLYLFEHSMIDLMPLIRGEAESLDFILGNV